jgi:predicted PurR-regulated permease PerM
MNGLSTARLLTQLWLITIAVLAVAVLYLAKILLLPLGIAVLFAFLLAPVVGFLERIHFPRPLAALAVILAFATLLLVATWTLFSQLVAIADDLPTYRDNITAKLNALHRPGNSAIGRAQREIEKISDELGIVNATATAALQPPHKAAEKPIGTTPEHPLQVREVGRPTGRLDQLGGIVEPLATAFLAVVFTFFVLLQREDLRNRIIRLSGDRNLTLMTQAMRDASRRISRYFLLQLSVNFVFGTLIATALYFIGLPHPLLFGALAALCRFVPYIGTPIAGIIPTLLSIAVFHGWRNTVLVAATFTLLEIVTANYVEPHIYGRHTGLSSLAVLIAAAFWTLIWGPVGLILSVPLTVCLVVMGSHVPTLRFLAVLLGDQPAIPTYTSFYQRLLAHDEREAADILDSALKSEPLVSVYDAVFIPALTLVEKDRQQGELDDTTISFIRETTSELVDELGFRALEEQAQSATESIDSSPSTESSSVPQSLSFSVSTDLKVAVLPVRDGSDSLVATMLAQVLSIAGFNATAYPIRSIDETVRVLADRRPSIVFLSGMPPVAMARASRLYRALRAAQSERRPAPNNQAEARNSVQHSREEAAILRDSPQQPPAPWDPKIVVGIWNYTDDPARAAQMISRSETLHISTSLADALAQASSLTEPKPAVPEPLDPSPQLVTTPTDSAA